MKREILSLLVLLMAVTGARAAPTDSLLATTNSSITPEPIHGSIN